MISFFLLFQEHMSYSLTTVLSHKHVASALFPGDQSLLFQGIYKPRTVCFHTLALVLCGKQARPLVNRYLVGQQKVKKFSPCRDVTNTHCPLNTACCVGTTILPLCATHNRVLVGLFSRYSAPVWSFCKLHAMLSYCPFSDWLVSILLYQTFYNMYKRQYTNVHPYVHIILYYINIILYYIILYYIILYYIILYYIILYYIILYMTWCDDI